MKGPNSHTQRAPRFRSVYILSHWREAAAAELKKIFARFARLLVFPDEAPPSTRQELAPLDPPPKSPQRA